EFTADGAGPTASMTGTEDTGGGSGPVSASAFNATYSIASSPADGRGAMTITSGTGGRAGRYVGSPRPFMAIPLSDPTPAGRTLQRSLHRNDWGGSRVDPGHYLRVLGRSEQNGRAHRDAFRPYPPLVADVKPDECRRRRTILHGHGDAERAGSRRGCPSHAFEQQYSGGQRPVQRCDRSGRSHQRNLHRDDQCGSCIDPGHYLRVLWWSEQNGRAHRD